MSKRNMIGLIACLLLIAASAGTVLASGGGEHADSGVLLKDFLWRCLNFSLTVAILVYFLTKPLRKGLAERKAGIAADLATAEQVKTEAEAKFAEYDQKLATASEEIEAIYQNIRHEGEQERDRIITNAKQMATQIRSEAEKSAALEISKARAELQAEASRMAVELAEGLLKKNFTAEDQTRLVAEYVQKVGELH